MKCRFEGMYFKQQSGEHMIAFIPAVHTDGGGKRTASLQVVTRDASHLIELAAAAVKIDRRTMTITTGIGTFSPEGIDIKLKTPAIRIAGHLWFEKNVPPHGDIMGPYRFVPLMACRHSVFSLTHTVRGSLSLNGIPLDFTDGVGYIEGDRGRSFPERYIWTQYSWKAPEPCSIMLSAALVKPLGKAFTGIIGFVYFKGKEYRIATYRGAKIQSVKNGVVTACQGPYELTARLLDDGGQTLSAPVSGAMTRLIRESLACRAGYRFSENGKVVFDFITERASFEYEY